MASGINDTFRQVGVAVGIAAWGAIFLGRGAADVRDVASGTPAAVGSAPRRLVEAASSGNLDQAVGSMPAGTRSGAAQAARDGFLSGINEILLLGGVLALAVSVVALLLVREREIERDEVAGREPLPEPSAA
jgi:hypothetical protein